MDFGLSEEQEMLKTMARDFLAKECPVSHVRAMEKDERGYSEQLWRKMAELGWLGLPFPAKYGGSDGSFVDLTVLVEEMGRALLPGPFLPTVVYCGLPLLACGTDAQKQQFLPRIARGEAVLTLALTEPGGGYAEADICAGALPHGDCYRVRGTKLFVPDAHVADHLLTAVRTERGITLLLVDARSPGVKTSVLKTLASDKLCEVVFDRVKVPAADLLGRPDEGWGIVRQIRRQAAVAGCAYMVGAARRAMEMTHDYVKERVQYGKPIGSYQSIQHQCVDMLIEVEGARHLTYQAAWRLSEGLSCDMEVSAAKAWTGAACSRACAGAAHLHGAIGYTEDHDAQLYLRRVKAAELTFGDAAFHEEVVAQQLGL